MRERVKGSGGWRGVVPGLSAAMIVLAGAAPALADVALPPPDDCPAGTYGTSGHGCSYCRPRTCVDDSDCGSPWHCGTAPLCVEEVDCCSRSGCTGVESAPSVCSGGMCAFTTSSCRTLSVCLPGGADGNADGGGAVVEPGSPGCGCSAATRINVLWLAACAVVAEGALALDRRRRRRG
ncbi:MAG: hypothetical protein HY907_16660 [Deltaproteobacteria bacterium]|nr:hypothetical protein [Deltaproteobacteria bacterium]